MQAIKKITFSTLGEKDRRPYYWNASSSYDLYSVEDINISILDFLVECGVDSAFEVREGSVYPWLWIFNTPYLFYHTSSNQVCVNISPAAANMVYNIAAEGAQFCYVVFSGNPKSAFVLRFYNPDESIHFVCMFADCISPYTNKHYGAFRYNFSNANMSFHVCFLSGNGQYGDFSTSPTTLKMEYSRLFEADFPEKILLWSTTSHGYLIRSVYYLPINKLPIGLSSSSYYQEEMLLGEKRYLNLSGFNGGLIQLDDDDPEVTEDELMGGLEG